MCLLLNRKLSSIVCTPVSTTNDIVQGVNLRMGPLNYLFMHTAEAGAYCLGVFDNGASGTLLGGITFRNILVEVTTCTKLIISSHLQSLDDKQIHQILCNAVSCAVYFAS